MDENQNNYSGGDGQNNNQNGYSYGESQNSNQNSYSYGESQNNNQNGYSYGESQNNNQSNYQYNGGQYPQYEEKPAGNKGMAIASLVVGIFAILCCCCSWLAAILGVVGILLAVFSKPKDGKMEGIAIGGLVCSIIGLVLGIILTICNVATMNSPEYSEIMDEYLEYIMEETYE